MIGQAATNITTAIHGRKHPAFFWEVRHEMEATTISASEVKTMNESKPQK
jgi:hypothetical protein